jgi:hypothetical protein
MIYWEADSNEPKVRCTACGSADTRVSFEFLSFARHTCRSCSTTTYSGGHVHGRGRSDDVSTMSVGGYADAAPSTSIVLMAFREPHRSINTAPGTR